MKKISFLRDFTSTHVMSLGGGIMPVVKPGEAFERRNASLLPKESVFSAGEELGVLGVLIEGKSRDVAVCDDGRTGAILDGACDGEDFKFID